MIKVLKKEFQTDLKWTHSELQNITELCPLKNVARENANKLEKRKRTCVTSHRPVNSTVNHIIPCLRRVHKYCFLLRQPKRIAIHRTRIAVISPVIWIRLYCLKNRSDVKLNYHLNVGFLICVKTEYA